jgi:small subunit ribosomal protein S23
VRLSAFSLQLLQLGDQFGQESATMVRQIRPAQVYKTVTKELNQQLLTPHGFVEPPWYKVVGRIPPSETIVRTIPPKHHNPKKTKSHKPKNLYRPQEITYPEDSLRQTFYRDHPWELARPRVVLELDGKDAQRCDWSKGVQQPGIALSGEW